MVTCPEELSMVEGFSKTLIPIVAVFMAQVDIRYEVLDDSPM